MIACVCRNISDKDFPDKEELLKRLKEQDKCCGQCCEDDESLEE